MGRVKKAAVVLAILSMLTDVVAAIIENNQTPEGIRVPKVLVPYCGFEMLDDKMD